MASSGKTTLLRIWRAMPLKLRAHGLITVLSPVVPRARGTLPPPGAPLYVAGFFQAATGLGQAARLYWENSRASHTDVRAIDLTACLMQKPVYNLFPAPLLSPAHLDEAEGAGTLVINVNPPVFMLALHILRRILPGKHRVAYWAWELMDIPAFWRRCLPFVDSIEVPSSFTAASIQRHTDKPVLVRPHLPPPFPANASPPPRRIRHPEIPLRILNVFDTASNFARKNPLGAVKAFQEAFGHTDQVQLIIKASSLDRFPDGKMALIEAVRGWNNITLLDTRLSAEALRHLFLSCDIFISLHRSEGYGLTLREAMSLGLEVIGTRWSGNMDFMRGDHCHTVPYKMIAVRDPQKSFPEKGQYWADPDIPSATRILRVVAARLKPGLTLPAYAETCPPPLTPEQVTVIVVHHAHEDHTIRCLQAVACLDERPGGVVIVNNSADQSATQRLLDKWQDIARSGNLPWPAGEYAGTPARSFIATTANQGFAAAVNFALRRLMPAGESRAFWLLNNDARPRTGALKALCARLNDRPDAGATASLLVLSARPDRLQCAGGGSYSAWTGLTRDSMRDATVSTIRTFVPEMLDSCINYLNAASMLVRREALQTVGLFDERYFLYYEDVDWCVRLRSAGYSLVIAPKSIVEHEEGLSTAHDKEYIYFLCIRNRLLFMKTHWKYRVVISILCQLFVGLKYLAQGDSVRFFQNISAIQESFYKSSCPPGTQF